MSRHVVDNTISVSNVLSSWLSCPTVYVHVMFFNFFDKGYNADGDIASVSKCQFSCEFPSPFHFYVLNFMFIFIEWASARVPPTPFFGGAAGLLRLLRGAQNMPRSSFEAQ